jgi:3-oxoacid CoA-transferase subunit A
MNKLYYSAEEALTGVIKHGQTIMVGGFGLCGIPEHSIAEIKRQGIRELTVVSNNCGINDFGLGILLEDKQIKKMISSYVGENKIFEKQFLNGEIEVELLPQGTLAEKIRSGGAGIPAFYTKSGLGTQVAEGKEIKEFNGQQYVMERTLWANVAIVRAWKADNEGNLMFRKTARNFNPIMATAADLVIAEVEEIVENGELDADAIHTPGIYVDRIFVAKQEKRIEKKVLTA